LPVSRAIFGALGEWSRKELEESGYPRILARSDGEKSASLATRSSGEGRERERIDKYRRGNVTDGSGNTRERETESASRVNSNSGRSCVITRVAVSGRRPAKRCRLWDQTTKGKGGPETPWKFIREKLGLPGGQRDSAESRAVATYYTRN